MKYRKLFESGNLIDESDSHVGQKSFLFQNIWSQNLCHLYNCSRGNLSLMDGLLGVFSVGGGKQKITV